MNCNDCPKNVSTECSNVIEIESGIEKVVENSSKLTIQILNVLKERDSKLIIFLISCNSVIVYYLWNWSLATDSLALKAYVNTVVFDICALAVCLISIWVEQNTLRESRRFAYSDDRNHRRGKFVFELAPCKSNGKPPSPHRQTKYQRTSLPSARTGADAAVFNFKIANSKHCYDPTSISVLGLEKYEVLALLVFSCFSLITGLLVAIDAIARVREQPVIHEGRLGLGAILGLVAHLVTIVAYPDAGLNHVVCKALPCPTWKGINPILGGNLISFVIVCAVHVAVHFWELYTVDTAATFAVIGLTVASMLPLAFYTTSIIFQRLSHHMSEQLDKCLRDALIIDGVLEFRNERFWTKSFGKLAGSLEVRIRKNADEYFVLQKVIKSLSQVVSTLSVQEFHEPLNFACNSIVDLPFEYYVDELLQKKPVNEKVKENRVNEEEKAREEEKTKEGEKEVDTGASVKIEEILNCSNPSMKPGRKQSERVLRGYATLLRNDQDYACPNKSYLFRDVPIRNALLLGSRSDLDDLQHPIKLYCQS